MLKDALDDFGKYVVQQSRSNLSKNDKNVSKNLYNSINYETKVNKNSFELTINMVDYGKFIDKGVKGSKSSAKAPNSPFKYTNKMPPAKVFSDWIVRKGFAPRNDKGQFQSRKSLQFAIARSVFLTGIKTTNFLTTPFERAFKRLPDDVVEAYGLELDSLMETTIL
jgi:hypothetical protein